MTDNSLLEDFADETREHLEELEGCLLQLEADPTNSELLNTIFRSMHTIKGASEYLGFERIARLSHRLENLLDSFREGHLLADKVAVDILIDARDRISGLVSQVESSGQENLEIDDLLDRVEAITSGEAAPGQETTTVYSGEADTELFEIFMEQLTSGLEQLLEIAGRIARKESVAEAVQEMGEQLDRLASTANYMGYDALSAHYDALHSGVSAFSSQAASAGDADIQTFLETTVKGAIDKIQQLFPDASLETIDHQFKQLLSEDWASSAKSQEGAADRQEPEDDLDEEPMLCLDFEDELVLDPEDEDTLATTDSSGDFDNSLLEDFADETREHLEELEGCLLQLEADPTNSELLNTIFRSMHTIKGASEYLGFERIARLSHRLENLLDSFREGHLLADKVAVDLLIDARDRISDLVFQVESSGQENLEIDDLLDRVEAITSGESAPDQEAATVYSGEADTELFEIFMEQLTSGLEQLLEIAGRIARKESVAEAVQEMREQVDRLASTANYMGYDALSTHYDALHSGINDFSSQAESAGDADIQMFLQTTVKAAIDKIQRLFPDAQSLAAMDTTMLNPVAIDEEDLGAPTETDLQPPSEFDQLLDGLPSIDDHERDILLSKSLDETFSSMKNGDLEIGIDADREVDQDPMAMQLSSGMEDDDTDPSPLETGVADSQTASFFDDFVEDVNDYSSALSSPKSTEADESIDSSGDDDGVDLWPEADSSFETVPESEAQEPEMATPAIDFSTPPPDQKEAETDTQENFAARGTARKSIRVDADKVDYLMNQVGELVVNRSSFSQLFSDMRELANYLYQRFSMDKSDQRLINDLTHRLNDATTTLGRVTSDLQEQVMKVRMLPIARLFNRYPRLVHDLLREGDKKVQLQFRGEETELDRMVIEQLADPMIHIIRNAVDHGIESVEERRRKGKQDSGILLLEAYHEGGNVVIEVTDDGKGIDLSRIRQKAVEKNLADRKTLDEMDQKALIDLIMLPGFSTTDQITHTSGRGVGMDVVKQSIEKINGSLKIETRQDVGTRFRIKIPLTLAIIPAMMIKCADRHFTVPMSAVEETLRIDPGEIFTVDGSEIMHLREEPLPLVKLVDLLNIKSAKTKDIDNRLFVVVLKGAAGRTGFIVDTLLGRQEVVIKPMEDYLQENSGFSGATILGDGGISLVLNVDELVIMAREREAERKLAAAVL